MTVAKPRASVLLRGPEGDPVLAVWSAGIGRAAAFTSDLKDRWGRAWTEWPAAARMIAQAARDVARRGDDARVRLEADASGGELHVRAGVIGDDGRAQSFRRLVVHVAGPDGFAREAALEAVGAGAYAATIPLSRPGTYLAVARDELSGEAVGTSGAVLGAGEELRPTGSDVALLGRIADLTFGKRRETLAGIFRDRASKRFAYDDAARSLLALAALALLLTVAVRRLAVPEALAALPARLLARFEARRAALAQAQPAEASLSVLLEARNRRARAREAPPVPAAMPQPLAAPPPPMAKPASAPTPASAVEAANAASRPLSAAEILLARRKGRGP